VAQRQRLKQQQHNIGSGFDGQQVAVVAAVAAVVAAAVALAIVLAEQWQWWIRQQSISKRQ
jgi:hypothetical protein